ncbi:hypothetical protein PIB30_076946 [Stylosanthes scabra]|uniref:Uncharacterized protein n=1 Tax=Stylosanthes scabra TaxID=79078 RepID=A0ABU6VPZ6_9FABA|nr:hypothetical protein [Stylosanthes scabra]
MRERESVPSEGKLTEESGGLILKKVVDVMRRLLVARRFASCFLLTWQKEWLFLHVALKEKVMGAVFEVSVTVPSLVLPPFLVSRSVLNTA